MASDTASWKHVTRVSVNDSLIILATIMIQYPTGIILSLKGAINGIWVAGFHGRETTQGVNPYLYMLNLITTWKQSDTDFTGMLTSTRHLLVGSCAIFLHSATLGTPANSNNIPCKCCRWKISLYKDNNAQFWLTRSEYVNQHKSSD